jgi:hypothetical protein
MYRGELTDAIVEFVSNRGIKTLDINEQLDFEDMFDTCVSKTSYTTTRERRRMKNLMLDNFPISTKVLKFMVMFLLRKGTKLPISITNDFLKEFIRINETSKSSLPLYFMPAVADRKDLPFGKYTIPNEEILQLQKFILLNCIECDWQAILKNAHYHKFQESDEYRYMQLRCVELNEVMNKLYLNHFSQDICKLIICYF